MLRLVLLASLGSLALAKTSANQRQEGIIESMTEKYGNAEKVVQHLAKMLLQSRLAAREKNPARDEGRRKRLENHELTLEDDVARQAVFIVRRWACNDPA